MTTTPADYPRLNALAVERVMGWTPSMGRSFCPCTNIADAAELCERVMDSPRSLELTVVHHRDGDARVNAVFVDPTGDVSFTGSAPTEPLARTLACLAAVGMDTEKELTR